ncbi:unnamed protein product [Lymnaea stagnalis]|uniref:Uncharacterized protein n=1 Tax=Lymnaea stagnalis TaxID=6523 RepID=A0AAV2HXT6_LYMST
MIMFLDQSENFDNLPSHIVCQYKCPYFVGNSQVVIKGPKDGRWMVGHSTPLRSCGTSWNPHGTPVNKGLYCYMVSKGVFIIHLNPPVFYTVRNCNLRVFLADVATIGEWPAIVDYHGMKGVTDELRLQKFRDELTYNRTSDYLCEKFHTPLKYASVNSVADKWSRTDVLLMFCGVAMANGVLSV